MSSERTTKKPRLTQDQDGMILSPAIQARILTYLIGNTADLAMMRVLSRTIRRYLLTAVAEDASLFVKPPNRRSVKNSLLGRIVYFSHNWPHMFSGNAFSIPRIRRDRLALFEGASVMEIRFVKTKGLGVEPFALLSPQHVDQLPGVCGDLDTIRSPANLRRLNAEVRENGFANPIARGPKVERFEPEESNNDEDDNNRPSHSVMRVLLTLRVVASSPCLRKVVLAKDEEDGTFPESLNLQTRGAGADDSVFCPLQCQCTYSAPIIDFDPAPASKEPNVETQDLQEKKVGNDGKANANPVEESEKVSAQSSSDEGEEKEDDSNGGEADEQAHDGTGESDDDESVYEEDAYVVYVLMDVVANTERLEMESGYHWTTLHSLVLQNKWDKIQESQSAVEGVATVDNLLTQDAANALNDKINALACWQEQNNAVDYHPNSNDKVRDIVHPGLYVYVKDKTPLQEKKKVAACTFSNSTSDNGSEDGSEDMQSRQEDDEDFWGRTYETSNYQWLPTYFSISPTGVCKIEDYINNMTPRSSPVIGPVYEALAQLFEQSLPYIESVYSYVRAARPIMRDFQEEDWDDAMEEFFSEEPCKVGPLEMEHFSLRGQKLQVISKIVDYELKPRQSHTGVWHVEGMSHEEIVLTVLYIADRDDSIEGSALQFKRAFFDDEVTYLARKASNMRPEAVETWISDGLTPLGTVETNKGRLIVFPNSHVHCVEEMMNDDMEKAAIAKRRIVVFFLVNPLRRIVSTREVAPQQESDGGWMSLDKAREHRLALMNERKYYKEDWNTREIELCEH